MVTTGIEQIGGVAASVRQSIEKVIVGKSPTVELVLVAILCEGHVLIEDVPGTGKTLLARTVARSLGCTFHRIQCTPDLLPSDVTGTHVFNQQSGGFEFRPGPVFAQIVLADEINRATPRTQSAFLEAMEERQVTVEGVTKLLPRPFLVLATQNPIELEGTFPLPEAQMDRFLLRLRMGYPSADEDRTLLARFRQANPLQSLRPVVSAEELLPLQEACRAVLVDPDVEGYLIKLVHATRQHPQTELGASPRAMLGLCRASQTLAAIRGRAYVIPDDVKYLAPFVLGHRVIAKAQSRLKGHTSDEILQDVLKSTPVPLEDAGGQKDGS
ncbi:MAG: MoxR family ATPase [Chloroflexota bacterium]